MLEKQQPYQELIRQAALFWSAMLLVIGGTGGAAIAEDSPQSPHRVVVGDPQLRTDHPWYPGELSCSTFERLFKTQAELYLRVTGRKANTDEDKAIASWYWRNLNYYHNFSPRERIWDEHFSFDNQDNRYVVQEYWSGLFSYGFALCGNTHAQYTAEMEHLLGHCRARAVGVEGHMSFEVFLKDPQYGHSGNWALLDHDVSTIVFDDPRSPRRLINLWDIAYVDQPPGRTQRSVRDRESLLDNRGAPDVNRGWFKAGLYFPNKNDDATNSDALNSYTRVNHTAPLSGYAAASPMISLRRNETLRRYLAPGLGDSTYVYWGPNMLIDGIPGPCRDRTWVCEPERMFRATRDTESGSKARYGNGVYTYKPNFADESYRDGVVAENEKSVTFEFYSPYAIAATPAPEQEKELWATLYPGCTNGLILTAKNADCSVQFSRDNGQSWSTPLMMKGETRVDLTDQAKSLHSYHLRLNAPAGDLAKMGITMRTVCMANDRLIPHLKSGGSKVTYRATGTAIFSAGPNVDQAKTFITDGGFGQDHVEMTVRAPYQSQTKAIYTSAQVDSKSPPNESVRYQIECSLDGGVTWQPIVHDWRIQGLGYQTGDSLSHTYCYGARQLASDLTKADLNEVMVRFVNDGGVQYRRAEVQLAYETPKNSPVRVTFQWTEGEQAEMRTASHDFPAGPIGVETTWKIATAAKTETRWVEMKLVEHGID